MPEVNVTGANAITYPYLITWEWHVALYLFLGGLVAGMMIFSSAFRLGGVERAKRAVILTDAVGLPLLIVGMLFLWVDLARRWNAWRFYATLQVTSPMSWGSWILLACMILLFLRLVSHIEPPVGEPTGNRFAQVWFALRRGMARVAALLTRWNRFWDVSAIVLGGLLGLYTGVLLNTIAARPLWNSSLLPFLFLISGMASGYAFLSLFAKIGMSKRFVQISLALGMIEFFVLLSYVLTLYTGNDAMRRASELLLNGDYAFLLWGVVIGAGLLVPTVIEFFEVSNKHLPPLILRTAAVLTLIGGVALRFVIVYAGLESFI